MRRVREVIVVEGRYDKNALKQAVEATVVETGGFGVFKDGEKLALLRRLAEERGLILLTDSDGAGFVIRNYLKGVLPNEQIKQAYIPDIAGKEARKRKISKEGKLGVEGMRAEIIQKALLDAGATVLDGDTPELNKRKIITKADLFSYGLSGGQGSAERRRALLKAMELPEHMSANALLEYINAVSDKKSLEKFLRML